MGTGKYSDKLGKSAVTRQTDRGRRETTTPHLNGRLPHKRKPLQWKPSLAINSDKRLLMTPKGDHIPKDHGGRLPSQPGQRRGIQVEGSAPTREKAGQPCGPTQAEAHSVSLRWWSSTKTQKQTQPKEGKQRHDRGLRKNTDRT